MKGTLFLRSVKNHLSLTSKINFMDIQILSFNTLKGRTLREGSRASGHETFAEDRVLPARSDM